MSLEDISRSNFEMKTERNALRIRLFSRRIVVDPREGIEELLVELPGTRDQAPLETVFFRERRRQGPPIVRTLANGPVRFPLSGSGAVEISLVSSKPVDPNNVPPPPWRPLLLLRRTLAEGRDRLHWGL
jgi:hypothetical protein